MVFSSMIFLWLFLPLSLILYYLVPRQMVGTRNVVLLLISLLFYSWGEPKYIVVLLLVIVLTWAYGIAIGGFAHKNIFLIMAIVSDLLVLFLFKYFAFFVNILGINKFYFCEAISSSIHLPLGISFFVFQSISYLVDVYRKNELKEKNLANVALYISFFPQLVAGPIVQYDFIKLQLHGEREDRFFYNIDGIYRFIVGLAKKVIIANSVAYGVDKIYSIGIENITGKMAWLAAVGYMLQIYFDFSGYSDMAIGLAKMFGFSICENFDLPYCSKSITEFWRRWHISLGSWFRNYVYIPLGGNRHGSIRTCANLLLVFLLTGIWHGAGFNYILWGTWNGFWIVVERVFLAKRMERFRILPHIYALIVIVIGWIMFRCESLSLMWEMLNRFVRPWNYQQTNYGVIETVGKQFLVMLVLGIGVTIFEIYNKSASNKNEKIKICLAIIMLFWSIVLLAGGTYNPFIYFRF
ncbi:MAG: MBOAT family O-acyltransferase [Agathobacter sp.]